MPCEFGELCAGGGVPHADRCVHARGGDAGAVVIEDDRYHTAGVLHEFRQLFAGRGIPDPSGSVQAGGCDACAVVAEDH